MEESYRKKRKLRGTSPLGIVITLTLPFWHITLQFYFRFLHSVRDPEPEVPLAAFFRNMAKVLPLAILMELLTSILGYLKQTPPEKFELDKFLATAIIGLVIGVLTVGFGWDYTTAQEWLANGAVTLYIYWTAKTMAIRVGWIKLRQPQPTAQT